MRKCIVIELANVWAVVQVEPARLLATCQHKEYATHIVNALTVYSDEVPSMEPEPEPEPVFHLVCARCGVPFVEHEPKDGHPYERQGGDAPKL